MSFFGKKNVISGNLQGFEQSNWEAKLAVSENTLTEPQYRGKISSFVKLFIRNFSEKF